MSDESTDPEDRFYAIARDLVGDETDPDAVTEADVRAALRPFRRGDLEAVAARWILTSVHAFARANARRVEQSAERTKPQAAAVDESLYLGKYKHGLTGKATGAVPRGCECGECSEVRDEMREREHRLSARLRQITDEFERDLRMQWTDELLASTFAVDGSGRSVTWGEASIEDHETRIGMLQGNASANLQAAARHQAAVNELRTSGVPTLADLKGVAA